MSIAQAQIAYRFAVAVGCCLLLTDHALAATTSTGAAPAASAAMIGRQTDYERTGVVTSVTIYADKAAVTRRVEIADPEQSQLTVRIVDLPAAVDSRSLMARAENGWTVTGVLYELVDDDVENHAEAAALRDRKRSLERKIADLESELRVLAKQEALYDAVAQRTAEQAASDLGAGRLDLDEIRRLADFLGDRHKELEAARSGVADQMAKPVSDLDRLDHRLVTLEAIGPVPRPAATITLRAPDAIADPSDKPLVIELTYLVTDVGWRPGYTIHALLDQPLITLELEALVRQTTGEDWTDVALALSTAPAVVRTQPPSFTPWSIGSRDANDPATKGLSDMPIALGTVALGQVTSPPVAFGSTSAAAGDNPRFPASPLAPARMPSRRGEKPIVSYLVPDRVSLRSTAEADHRLHLATIVAPSDRRYVAAPQLAEHAYLRGTVTNRSQLHLLPGVADIFLGGRYMGEVVIPLTPSGARFEVFLGIDHRVAVRQLLRSRQTKKTGLLGDGIETRLDYRIELINDTGRSIKLELWDRIPVSRDDAIKVSLARLSDSLSDDDDYQEFQRPQGLLRWDLQMAPARAGNRSERRVDYSVLISHSKDVRPDFGAR